MYLTLFVISYPSLCTSAAILLLAFGTLASFSVILIHTACLRAFPYIGILAGVWSADDLGFQLGCVVILLLPIFIGLLFAISSYRGAQAQGESEHGLDDIV